MGVELPAAPAADDLDARRWRATAATSRTPGSAWKLVDVSEAGRGLRLQGF